MDEQIMMRLSLEARGAYRATFELTYCSGVDMQSSGKRKIKGKMTEKIDKRMLLKSRPADFCENCRNDCGLTRVDGAVIATGVCTACTQETKQMTGAVHARRPRADRHESPPSERLSLQHATPANSINIG
ncbi:hypothetical protein EVAR_52235_1 [Eumeta japonica]|uniref:Uncharacterized protein n=1 Tax=Eumeta variegata TaxID=151549 RepID=A0A4C1YZX8_EUMVA|nr:hypothetical protein EVAR_52235_1 [Eumeta japonica]